MSANSQAAQQQQQHQQIQHEPLLAQFWQDFGEATTAVSEVIMNRGGGTNAAALKNGDSHASSSGSNNNVNNSSNYVNFNQFIMQHNLEAGHNAANGSGGAMPRVASHGDFDTRNGFSNYRQQTFGNKTMSGGDNYQQHLNNYFEPNSNLYQYNNALETHTPSTSYSNGQNNYSNDSPRPTAAATATASTTNQNCYENVYTPFGNNGTTYFMNPFATGFDFNASNLQVSAPEFVPRFNNLSLNEANKNNIAGATTTTTAIQKTNGQNYEDNNKLKHTKAANAADAQMLSRNAKANNNFNMNTKNAAATTSSTSASSSSSASPTVVVGSSTGATSKSSALRASSSTGFNNKNGGNGNNNNSRNVNSASAMSLNAEKIAKSNAVRAERERERDNRRYQSARRSDDSHENERYERPERSERGSYSQRGNRDRDYHQRYENHRSNKRRDDWNRNRDRINGFRVEEKYSNDNSGGGIGGKESPLASPEKKPSPKKNYAENEKLSQREKLIRDIETRRLECLVCVEPIKGHHSVWSCSNCYHILHLQCIIKWASSSKSDDGWRCPACQNVVKEVPRDYYCFCSKVKNPPYNRQDIAHSCGEVCGRVEGCSHACTLLCHPGPCPPCQANVKRECGCGRTTKIMQCCLKETIECDSTCGKMLNCELHSCKAKCHEGKCEPCCEKIEQICHCSKQERQVLCTRDSHDKHTYSCGKPCGKDLTCGNHKCKDCCHAGECRLCKLSPEVVTSCPCGKMPVVEGQRKSCLDPIPVCEGVCGKTLRCGKAAHPHHCTSKCHLGNCPPCNKQTAVKCRCGHMDQMIKCRQLSTRADDARCKKRCVKKRSCGKHKCNQECCIDIDHICPLPCNYTLSCGKHKCDQTCHRGNCPPCYRSSFEELYCECGAEVIYPPVPCGTKRPPCKRPCSRTHSCEHPPQHNCHSATTCPPCIMFTTKWCYGQHEQRKTIPCSQESFSCGLPCNKELACGRHKCVKACHEGVCQTAGEICKQSCTKLRDSCGHKCMAVCHTGECPDTPCKEMVEVQCECGNRKQMRACHDLAREFSRIATAQLASSMAEMQRGNYMELSEILAPVKMNKTNKTLDCNEECRLLERNRRLAIGLQIRNPDVPQKLLTKYSDFTRNFAKRDPTLVKSIHDALTNLVKLAKESKQKSRSHSFPTMNREKRQLVHELCEMFGVESVAYDAEPNRNVVATAYKERSWLPATSIMEVMQREAGQRRVPVPSNNAWGIKR